MVSEPVPNTNDINTTNLDVYTNVMQGKVLFNGNQSLPKVAWNQIKILVISNKHEFDIERDMLVTETLPKLQQYFLTQGIYVYFIDWNLNWDFDSSKNPYHILRYMKEMQHAYETSSGLFLLTFVGNKYGQIVLPIELSVMDFNNIKNSATDLGKDVKLLERWYLLDDRSSPSVYKLKDPDENFINLSSRSLSTYDLNTHENFEWNEAYINLVDLFLNVVHEKSNSKTLHDIPLLSGVEMLFNFSTKLSSSGSICVVRQLDGLTEKSKGNECYIDLLPGGRLDKIRQEKLKRFRELLTNKLSTNDTNDFKTEDNLTILNIPWKDSGDFQSNDSDYQRYLRTLNASIFLRIKSLNERFLDITLPNHFKLSQQILYNETLVHLTYYSKLLPTTCLGFEHFVEQNYSFKQWLTLANTSEHYPYMIFGSRASGKTLLCTKIVQYLLNTIGKNAQCIVRYLNLTSRSRHIGEVFSSICSQISSLQNVSIEPNEQSNNRIESYQSILKNQSKNQKPLILMIDGIEEITPQSQYIPSMTIYQTLLQLLPPKVYVILSVSRSIHSSSSSDVQIREMIDRIEKENCLIELPFTKLNSLQQNLTDSILQILSKSIYQQLDKQSQIFYLLRLILNETYLNYLSQERKKFDSINFHLDEILNAYIDHCEQKFGPKICSFIFNYISSSQSAISEIELLDILSCNNEFFLEYFPRDLPKYLRFPPSLWIAIKHVLGPLLTEKYFDLKVMICWSHSFIRRHMKQRYLKRVEDIRIAHRDISNYFLEAFIESKPLIEMNRNVQIRGDSGRRFLLQQPLLYSETAYNYRRLGELWYQLMHSGDIDRLKEYTLCCFEYLLSKIHGLSIEQLLWEFDIICSNILDVDVLLIQATLKKIANIVSEDPMLLAGEITLRLKNIKSRYNEHIESLYVQAHEWCESCGSPVFVPLSSWISTIPPMTITILPCPDGVFKIIPTTFNQHVFCATRQHDIAMYHIPSKKLVKKFTSHAASITSIRLTYNNKYLVSASTDRTIKLFNLNSGDLENTYNIHQDEILCMTVSHNNEHIITGSRDRLIVVLRLETGEVEHSVEQHTDAVTAVAITQDDGILVSASRDQTIKRWTFRGMQLLDIIDTVGSPIRHMIISTDDTFIIAACDDTSVQVKSLVTGSDIHRLEGHSAEVTSLALSQDSVCCYVGCSNSHVYAYNFRSRLLLRTLTHHESAVTDLYVSADNCFLFSAAENAIHVLNVKQQFNGFPNDESLPSSIPTTALSISREGDVAIAGSADGIVRLFNLIDGELTEQSVDHRAPVTQVALSHSYLFSLSGSKDTTVKVFDNEMGEIVTEFTAHSAPISHLRILEDNRKILSGDEQNYIKTWWANTGELIDSYNVPCKMLAVSPDGKYVVSGNGDNILKIWSLDDARVVRSIDHTEGKITCMAFRADSQYLVTGGEDCSCKLWELSSGKLTQVLVEHEQSITAVAIGEDGKYVLTGDKEGQAILWLFKDGTVVYKLLRHKTAIVCVSLTTDGTIAITASHDGLLSVWSTITGIYIATFHFNHNLVKLNISPNGGRYAAILQNTSCVAMLSLFNISSNDASKLAQRHSQMFSDTTNMILPIKPKPLLYPKDANILTNSRHSSKTDQIVADTVLVGFRFLSYEFIFSSQLESKLLLTQIINRKLIIDMFDSCMLRISMLDILVLFSRKISMNVSCR
ncbi:hypothetical protein I4U23_014561 [Adineta vaga]|nr:hypothetical protein I4U23_014561 [Adineta vaga]